MRDSYIKCLSAMTPKLQRGMMIDDEFLGHAIEKELITDATREEIKAEKTTAGKVLTLVDMLKKSPDKKFGKFRQVLLTTNQEHICDQIDIQIQIQTTGRVPTPDVETNMKRESFKLIPNKKISEEERKGLNEKCVLKEDFKTVHESKTEIEDKNKELSEQVEKLESDIKRKDAMINGVASENKLLKTQKEQLETRVEKAEIDNKLYKNQINDMEKTIADLTTERDELLEQLEQESEVKVARDKELEDLRRQLATVIQERDARNRHIQRLEEQVKCLKQQIAAMEKELAFRKQHQSELQKSNVGRSLKRNQSEASLSSQDGERSRGRDGCNNTGRSSDQTSKERAETNEPISDLAVSHSEQTDKPSTRFSMRFRESSRETSQGQGTQNRNTEGTYGIHSRVKVTDLQIDTTSIMEDNTGQETLHTKQGVHTSHTSPGPTHSEGNPLTVARNEATRLLKRRRHGKKPRSKAKHITHTAKTEPVSVNNVKTLNNRQRPSTAVSNRDKTPEYARSYQMARCLTARTSRETALSKTYQRTGPSNSARQDHADKRTPSLAHIDGPDSRLVTLAKRNS